MTDNESRETQHFEAKAAQGGLPESVWATYSAFANTEGGTIVLGMAENPDGTLKEVGVSRPERLVETFWNTVNNPTKVSANILAGSDVAIERSGKKALVRIRVPQADRRQKPVYLNGNPMTGSFRRNGEGDYRCTRAEVEAMIRDASPAPTDTLVLAGFNLDALCADTISAYRAELKAAKPAHPWLLDTDEELLAHLGAAGRVSGDPAPHPTRAGLLMFGYEHQIVREFPDYFLDYREERGNARWDDRVVSDNGEWSGNVFDFWRRVSVRLTAGLRRPFALDEKARRVDDTSMHRAVREGLANCLVHADYYGSRYVVVVQREDRTEYANPGALRVPVAVAFEGGTSDARNATLMKMFGLLEVCEKAGSGFAAMRRAAVEFNADAPLLQESFNPDRTKLTLFLGDARPGHRMGSEDAAAGYTNANEAQHHAAPRATKENVLALIEQMNGAARADVDSAFSISPAQSKRILAALVGEGRVAADGRGRATRYRLVQ